MAERCERCELGIARRPSHYDAPLNQRSIPQWHCSEFLDLTGPGCPQVPPNILCFSGALLSLRGARRGASAWKMATALVSRMAVARVAMDVARWKFHAMISLGTWSL